MNHSVEPGRAPRAQRSEQPGFDDARLPTPARADQNDETAPDARLTQPSQQPLHYALPPEEVGCIGLLKWT